MYWMITWIVDIILLFTVKESHLHLDFLFDKIFRRCCKLHQIIYCSHSDFFSQENVSQPGNRISDFLHESILHEFLWEYNVVCHTSLWWLYLYCDLFKP